MRPASAHALATDVQNGRVAPIVLVVDDDRPILKLLGDVLGDLGYRVLLTADAREGLVLAREWRPALVITDWMMPTFDGAQFAAALRAQSLADRRHAPPIVVMTAAGQPTAEDVGADAVFYKPFDLTTLEDLLERFVGLPQS